MRIIIILTNVRELLLWERASFFYLFCGQGEMEECLMVQEDSDGRDGLY